MFIVEYSYYGSEGLLNFDTPFEFLDTYFFGELDPISNAEVLNVRFGINTFPELDTFEKVYKTFEPISTEYKLLSSKRVSDDWYIISFGTPDIAPRFYLVGSSEYDQICSRGISWFLDFYDTSGALKSEEDLIFKYQNEPFYSHIFKEV